MAILENLQPASYKGASFLVESASLAGGRKTAKHEFPNSNIQNIEDLGLKPREYRIPAIINEPDYFNKKDALLRALESGGGGVLIHPFFGRIENMIATDYNLVEDMSKLGDLVIQIDFKPSNSTGVPIQSENTISIVENSGSNLFDSITSDIENIFNVTNTFTGNYNDAQRKLNDFVFAVTNNTKTLSTITSKANELNSVINNFQSSINVNINNPKKISEGFSDIFSLIPELYETPESQFSVLSLFFDFGDNDVPINQTTAGRIERKNNRDLINQSVKSYALSAAYTAASKIDFKTVSEIESVESSLEKAFQSISSEVSL